LAEENVDNGSDETVQWTLTDRLNTVRDIAKYDPGSDITTVVNHLIYDAFGRVTSESNPTIDSLFLFTASSCDSDTQLQRPFDSDTQLQNNFNRWYDFRVGRWLSEDPIGFAGGDGNLYRYCNNSPITARDPNGHQSIPNPRGIYDRIVQQLGRRAATKAADVMVAHLLQVRIGANAAGDTETDTWVGPLQVNSTVAQALGFDLSGWVNAKSRAERMSTDRCKVRVLGLTTLSAFWRPVWLLERGTNTSHTGYRIDYFVTFWQTVTITDLCSGKFEQYSGAIFVAARSVFIVSGVGVLSYDEVTDHYQVSWRR